MNAAVEATSRQQWESLVAHHPAQPSPEHRRHESRRHTEIGTVELVYKAGGRAVQRTGKLLNISLGGLLIREQEHLDCGTKMLIQARLDQRELLLVGQVAHCTETVGGYKVGIELLFPGGK